MVTGGAGFIGSNIVRALNKKNITRITIVDSLDSPLKRRNLEGLRYERYVDKRDFREQILSSEAPSSDVVFHMGACSSTTETDEKYLMDNNFAYTRDLCEWCLRNNARFIYASSAATYGNGSLGYSDDDALVPRLAPLNLYGKSKQAFDMWALDKHILNRVVGLKYFNVYGPGEDHKGDMRSLVNKAYANVSKTGRMSLFRSHRPDYRDGEQDRDFIHVDDAVNVTLFFMDNPGVSGLFNCGTGRARTWMDLARALFAAMGRQPAIDFVDMPPAIRPNYQYHTEADMRRLRATGCKVPFTSLEEGVKKYVEYLSSTPCHGSESP